MHTTKRKSFSILALRIGVLLISVWCGTAFALIETSPQLVRQCAPGSRQLKLGVKDITVIDSVLEWAGGCAEGLRDGFGTLTERQQTIDPDPDASISSSTTAVSQGAFVRGDQVGLWCAVKWNWTGNALASGPIGCQLRPNPKGPNIDMALYRKADDGRWQALDVFGKDFNPATYLPAGSLERESETLIADTRAGRVSEAWQVGASSIVLEELVRGSRIKFSAGTPLPELKTKRVALVMSSNTVVELERFRKMRQDFIKVHGVHGYFKKYLTDFIAASDPSLLLAGVTSALHSKFASVVAADDLSVLRDGTADYVLIFDWRFTGNFAITREQYRQLPACTRDEFPTVGCTETFHESASAWLVDPTLTAIRNIKPITIPVENSTVDDKHMDGLLEPLAWSFQSSWAIENGSIGHGLVLGLSY